MTRKLYNITLLACIIFCFASFFINSEEISNSVINSLIFCFARLIPSIFPYMILSMLLSKNKSFMKICEKLFSNILNIDLSYVHIVVSSWISGFIMGPKCISEKTILSDQDNTRAIFLSTNAGIGFTVAFVGMALWKSIKFGIFIYLTQIITSIILSKLFRSNKQNYKQNSYTKVSLISNLTSSIESSTVSLISITGFTVFFSTLICTAKISFALSTNDIGYSLIASIFEISSGCFSSLSQSNRILSAFLCGFSVGFGGLCIILQTFSLCKNLKIKKCKFVVIKAIHGIICGTISAIYVILTDLEPSNEAFLTLNAKVSIVKIIISAVFFYFLINFIKNIIKKKIY